MSFSRVCLRARNTNKCKLIVKRRRRRRKRRRRREQLKRKEEKRRKRRRNVCFAMLRFVVIETGSPGDTLAVLRACGTAICLHIRRRRRHMRRSGCEGTANNFDFVVLFVVRRGVFHQRQPIGYSVEFFSVRSLDMKNRRSFRPALIWIETRECCSNDSG